MKNNPFIPALLLIGANLWSLPYYYPYLAVFTSDIFEKGGLCDLPNAIPNAERWMHFRDLVTQDTNNIFYKNDEIDSAKVDDYVLGSGDSSKRHYYEFQFFYGHGKDGIFHSKNDEFHPAHLKTEYSYSQWMFFNACDMFHGHDIRDRWSQIFRGVKAVMGFSSFISEPDYHSVDVSQSFWHLWINESKPLFEALWRSEQHARIHSGQSRYTLVCIDATPPHGDGSSYCGRTYGDEDYDIADTSIYHIWEHTVIESD